MATLADAMTDASDPRPAFAQHGRRVLLAGGMVVAALTGSCTCTVSGGYGCYDYYGTWWGSPYCDYGYMDPWYPSGGYYPAYYETLEPTVASHPDPLVVETKVSTASVTLSSYIYIKHEDDIAEGDAPRAPSTLESSHPCGTVADSHIVLCDADGATARDEDYLVIGIAAEQEFEQDHTDDFLVVTFAFQRDTDPTNDYVPPPDLANDYAGGTDKWYVASRTPDDGWSLEVFESDGTGFTTVDSDARMVLQVETAVLMVPAAEFEVDAPGSRVSLFRHGGDGGLGPDADWDGFVHPPLNAPLIQP